ncbi:unnamed protein product [Prorocentrum cordatum]|uniref:BTB domain-containing protein n=1 Tax=Prorocentrum cordatum TaxID=2364126 RepID=A0ABN9WTC9_9DINO|nr:unnamed protein product [Polarella glacialis]
MADTVITLNVGGILFTATRPVLEQSSFFEGLLRNQGRIGNATHEGNLYIDRDGEAFRDILAFMRSGCPVAAHSPPEILDQEAKFYDVKNFQTMPNVKKVFLPASTTNKRILKGVYHDETRTGVKRYRFDSEQLPADVPSCAGRGGQRGCVPLDTLTKKGFRNIGSSTDEPDDEVTFQRTATTHYVDLQEFVVPDDGSTWDVVQECEVKGHRYAIVTKYH